MSFLPITNSSDINAVKNLSHSERETLIKQINSTDPHYIFKEAGQSRNPDKRKIICPNCGNGSGDDATPVEATLQNNVWLYHCFKGYDLEGDLLKIISTEEHLNLNQFDDLCHALAIGANLIGQPLFISNSDTKHKENIQHIKHQSDSSPTKEFLKLIHKDIQDAQFHLQDLPKEQRRGLSIHTMAHFGFGFLEQWTHPNSRLEEKRVTPTRRIIIPSENHYNAVALPEDRKQIEKKYWKMHTKPMELFNSRALSSNSDLILVTEGEIDAASIWQAFEEKISVVAVLGVANWKATLLPKLDNISNKKFLILFDAEKDSRKQAENLRGELVKRGLPATCRFFYDALLNRLADNPNDTLQFDVKIDANQILQEKHEDFLRTLTQELINSARADFDAIEKNIAIDSDFKNKISAWQSQNHNNPIAPPVVEELKAAISYVDSLSTENFNPLDVDDLAVHRKIALLKFYIPTLARKFFTILRNARDVAKKKLKETNEPTDELKSFANISPSSIEKTVDSTVSSIKSEQKNFQRKINQESSKNKIESNADSFKKPDVIDERLKLTDNQRAFLFSGDLSDLDNARRIEYLYGRYIRFVTNRNQWLTFKNGLWIFSDEGNSAISPATTELADKLIANASSHDDMTIARRLKSAKAVDSAVKSLRGLNSIRITSNDLNRHNNLLNCLNGVIDLQTGKFYETVDPTLLITQQCNAIYRPNYHNKVVEKFLHDILPDEETLAALIRYLGYSATGECSEEKALFFNGGGGNGKGTLTRTLIILFGSYATTLKTSAVLLTGKTQDAGAATTELNPLEDCRIAIIEELPQGGKLDVAKFKNLTGSDFIPIRRLHQEQINIEPHFSPILSGNYLPELSDTRDPGLLRRLMNIYFTQSFIGNKRDPHLKEKLVSPDALSGFLSLIVDAAKLWYRDGLLESNAMRQATRNYLNENDFISEFISEHCTRGANLSIPRKQFLDKLKSEYPAECIRLFNNRDRALVDAIRRINGISYDNKGGTYRFQGIGWRD